MINMMHENKFITVVIPTRDRRDRLAECLESLGNQSLPAKSYEIIVVDDGSTDGTGDLLEEISKNSPNIRHLSQQSGGPSKARNLGIENAGAPIILFTGDDCVADRHLLREHLRLHKKGNAVAVLGHIEWHPNLEVTPFMRYITIDTQFSYPRIKEAAENVPFHFFYTSNISVSKRSIEIAGAFDEEFHAAAFEDIELGYRLWRSGVRIVYNPRAVTYHHHPVDLEDYIRRQIKSGRAAAILYRKHPELADSLQLPRVTSPEVRMRFYQAVLDYYYFVGLQEGMQPGRGDDRLVPIEDRLKNWSDTERDRLVKSQLALEKIIRAKDREISRCAREKRKKDELILLLDTKNRDKYSRLVELEKFELRVKSSFIFKIFGMFKKFLP